MTPSRKSKVKVHLVLNQGEGSCAPSEEASSLWSQRGMWETWGWDRTPTCQTLFQWLRVHLPADCRGSLPLDHNPEQRGLEKGHG